MKLFENCNYVAEKQRDETRERSQCQGEGAKDSLHQRLDSDLKLASVGAASHLPERLEG